VKTETVAPIDLTQDLVLRVDVDQEPTGGEEPVPSEPPPIQRRTADIPAEVINTLSENDASVVMETQAGTISIPAGALVPPTDPEDPEQPADPGTDVSYRLDIQSVDPERVTSTESPAETQFVVLTVGEAESDGLRTAGRVVSLTAERIERKPDGKTTVTPLTTFGKPVTVRIPFDEVDDPTKVAVYRLNEETGEWEYRGGRVNVEEGYVEIELTSFSQYAVMEFYTFRDIQGHWGQGAIQRMATRRLVKGVGDDLFAPDRTITRAEFVALVVRMMKLSAQENADLPYLDVKAADWFFPEVAAAVQGNLIPADQTLFRPNDAITRQEMAQVLAQAMILRGIPVNADPTAVKAFADGADVADWALDQVAQVVNAGLMHGRGQNQFAPTASATRAEATKVLEGLLNLLKVKK